MEDTSNTSIEIEGEEQLVGSRRDDLNFTKILTFQVERLRQSLSMVSGTSGYESWLGAYDALTTLNSLLWPVLSEAERKQLREYEFRSEPRIMIKQNSRGEVFQHYSSWYRSQLEIMQAKGLLLQQQGAGEL